MDEFADQARLFKVLMHPARLSILEALRGGEQCVCHLEAVLGQRQAYISQQLMMLREAGLVSDRRDGWNVFYHVTNPGVFGVIDAAGKALGQKRHAAPKQAQVEDCPCPKCQPEITGVGRQPSQA